MNLDRDDRERECRGDLVARERRGTLSASDQLALGAHLESCPSCRLTRDIRADFDAQNAVELGDAARIARLSAAARRWSQRRARPAARLHRIRNRLRSLGLTVMVLLIAGTASATMWWWRAPLRSSIAESPRVGRPVPPPAPRVSPRKSGAGARVAPPVTPDPVELEPAPAVKEARRATHPRAALAAARESAEPASSLLRRAGDARHRGEIDVAFALYRRLQREFRDTPEAALSSVLMGGILLQRGQAAPALEQFDRYLAAQPRGNLIPEALYGRGRALAAIGRGDDERQAWRRLLEEFPGSAYAPHAQRRLTELK